MVLHLTTHHVQRSLLKYSNQDLHSMEQDTCSCPGTFRSLRCVWEVRIRRAACVVLFCQVESLHFTFAETKM